MFVFIYPSQRVLKKQDPDNITLLLYRIAKKIYVFVKKTIMHLSISRLFKNKKRNLS